MSRSVIRVAANANYKNQSQRSESDRRPPGALYGSGAMLGPVFRRATVRPADNRWMEGRPGLVLFSRRAMLRCRVSVQHPMAGALTRICGNVAPYVPTVEHGRRRLCADASLASGNCPANCEHKRTGTNCKGILYCAVTTAAPNKTT